MKQTIRRATALFLGLVMLLLGTACSSIPVTTTESQGTTGATTDPATLTETLTQTMTTPTTTEEDETVDYSNKAAVYILLGQSNAVGHGLNMTANDKITTRLDNVYGLSRAMNQSFTKDKLYWTGYTSNGMNLAEEQDHTYSVANCLARQWQDAIDDGANLPDLYIIQIAIGAQGVTQKYMWNPAKAQQLIPGKLGTVKISLYSYTNHFFSLLRSSFEEMGKEPEIMGIHWMGGENDFTVSNDLLKSTLKGTYKTIFNGFYETLNERVPTILYRINCPDRCNDMDPSGKYLINMNFINETFEQLCAENDNITMFDTRTSPDFIAGVEGNGIFGKDNVHYTKSVMQWIAKGILQDNLKKYDPQGALTV